MKIANQKLSEKMMNHLCESYTAGIRRITIKNHMKTTCSQHDFLAAVNCYAQDKLTKNQIELNEQIMTAHCNNLLTRTKEKCVIPSRAIPLGHIAKKANQSAK